MTIKKILSLSATVLLTVTLSSCGHSPSTQSAILAESRSKTDAMQIAVKQWLDQRDAIFVNYGKMNASNLKATGLQGQTIQRALLRATTSSKIGTKFTKVVTDFLIESAPNLESGEIYVQAAHYYTYSKGSLSGQVWGEKDYYKLNISNSGAGYKVTDSQIVDLDAELYAKFSRNIETDLTKLNPPQPIQTVSSQSFGYDRDAAADYARKWAYSYNLIPFGAFGFGAADCTNFSSQVLKAGGWVEVGYPDRASSSSWFFRTLIPKIQGPSYSWASAEHWPTFALSSRRAVKVSSISELEPGDIIQADWDASGTADHTIVVNGINSTGERLIASHSEPHVDMPFSEWVWLARQKNPATKFYYFHIVATE